MNCKFSFESICRFGKMGIRSTVRLHENVLQRIEKIFFSSNSFLFGCSRLCTMLCIFRFLSKLNWNDQMFLVNFGLVLPSISISFETSSAKWVLNNLVRWVWTKWSALVLELHGQLHALQLRQQLGMAKATTWSGFCSSVDSGFCSSVD